MFWAIFIFNAPVCMSHSSVINDTACIKTAVARRLLLYLYISVSWTHFHHHDDAADIYYGDNRLSDINYVMNGAKHVAMASTVQKRHRSSVAPAVSLSYVFYVNYTNVSYSFLIIIGAFIITQPRVSVECRLWCMRVSLTNWSHYITMSLWRGSKAVDDIDDVFDELLCVRMPNENGWQEEKHFGRTQMRSFNCMWRDNRRWNYCLSSTCERKFVATYVTLQLLVDSYVRCWLMINLTEWERS